MKPLSAFALLICVAMGCSKPAEQAPPPSPATNQPAKIKIAGQVYIATKGGDNIELGSVEIRLVERKAAAIERKRLMSLGKTMYGKAELLEAQYKEADARAEMMSAKRKNLLTQESLDQERLASMNASWQRRVLGTRTADFTNALEQVKARLAGIAQELQTLTKEISQTETEADRLRGETISELKLLQKWERMDWLAGEWPGTVSKKVTDSNGRFEFEVPEGEYTAVAASSRRLATKIEHYRWFVEVEQPELMLHALNCEIITTDAKD